MVPAETMVSVKQSQLHRLGYWEEDGTIWPHPSAFVDQNWETHNKTKILNYLKSGVCLLEYMGFSFCRFDCGISDEETGNCEFTDGVWVWPEGLLHYVDKHNVRLPNEFVDTMKKNNFKVPSLDVENLVSLPRSLDFWTSWSCKTKRP